MQIKEYRPGLPAPFALLLLAAAPAAAQAPPTWAEIGALFAERCVMCHSGESAPLGLQLDSYEGATKGSQNGPVLLPGEPAQSPLVKRLKGEAEPRMPLVGDPFTPEEIARVESWIAARLPRGETAPVAASPAPAPAPPAAGEPVTFAHVAPIFLKRCAVCHSDNSKLGVPPEGLRLDTWENIARGGERAVLVPGRPTVSEIQRRIEGKARPRMPFGGPYLSDDEIALMRRWIEGGATGPTGEAAPMPAGRAVRFRGRLTEEWAIEGAPFTLGPGVRIDKAPRVGGEAEMRGVVEPDGTVRATRLRER